MLMQMYVSQGVFCYLLQQFLFAVVPSIKRQNILWKLSKNAIFFSRLVFFDRRDHCICMLVFVAVLHIPMVPNEHTIKPIC